MNAFGDLTSDEFSTRYSSARHRARNTLGWYTPSGLPLPSERDWRKSGDVTPVRKQSTGYTAPYAVVGAIEGAWRITKLDRKDNVSVSQVIDCCPECWNDDGSTYAYARDKGINFERFYVRTYARRLSSMSLWCCFVAQAWKRVLFRLFQTGCYHFEIHMDHPRKRSGSAGCRGQQRSRHSACGPCE